jgi:RNA polymerase sigma-70 factor (ECF subfamily)
MQLLESTVDLAELAALGKVFEEHRAKLLAMVKQRMDSALAARIDPEEILNETFLRARDRWPDFKQSGMTSYSWLYQKVLECLFDQYDRHTAQKRDIYRQRRLPRGSASQIGVGLVNRGTSPSGALARKELEERMRQTLGMLRPEDMEILCMRHYDQLSLTEAAQVLGISDGTARQRYARARLRLRELWKKLYGQEGL